MDRISTIWPWLERTLNGIIDQVNRQKPLQSASIAVEESPNGTLLKVVGTTQSDQSSGGGGQPMAGGWQAVSIIDNSSGTCVTKTLVVWAQGPPQ
jgi:hypothetical protein